jgi:hypothetical protein
MSLLRNWLGAGLLFLSPALAAGQAPVAVPPPTVRSEVPSEEAVRGISAQDLHRTGPTDLKKMYEDIEILRRLLNRDLVTHQMGQCASCHGPGTGFTGLSFAPDGKRLLSLWQPNPVTLAFSPDGNHLAVKDGQVVRLWDANTGKLHGAMPDAHPFTGVEGTYLRGVGIVYTVTLPIPPENVSPPSSRPAPPPLSDWERVRRQVTGEAGAEPPPHAEAGKGSAAVRQPSLRDVLLKTLAENGRHFTLLSPNETLTVVVIFRGSEKVQPSKVSGMLGGVGDSVKGLKNLANVAKAARDQQDAAEKGGAPALAEWLHKPTSARDYELLGDLISKKGKLDEAVKAYQTAIELGAADKAQTAALYRKLAQLYLQRSEDAQALEVLQKAREFIAAAKGSPKAPKAVKASAALPAQLVITVPRALADSFGSGQLTLEQFRRAAHVELRKFTAEN